MFLLKNYSCKICDKKIYFYQYKPSGSKKGSKVAVCNKCCLVQSVFKNVNNIKKPSLSANADWGNVRHGKKLRLDNQKKLVNFENYLKGNVLDIGSNRGDFIKFASEFNNVKNIYAVEPDKKIIEYENIEKFNVINKSIEDVKFDSNLKFNFIYCSHTLEHLNEFRILFNLFDKHLHEDGKIFIDIPNIKFIENKSVVEEFFIDKHTFHFSKLSFKNLTNYFNFEIVLELEDGFNLIYVIKNNYKENKQNKVMYNHESKIAKKNIKKYKKYLKINRSNLESIVSNELKKIINEKKVVIWGAGRILDSLIKYGYLKLNEDTMLVDKYLKNLPNDIDQKVYGNKIFDPSELNNFSPDYVLILANSAEHEIKELLRDFPEEKVILWSEIIEKY